MRPPFLSSGRSMIIRYLGSEYGVALLQLETIEILDASSASCSHVMQNIWSAALSSPWSGMTLFLLGSWTQMYAVSFLCRVLVRPANMCFQTPDTKDHTDGPNIGRKSSDQTCLTPYPRSPSEFSSHILIAFHLLCKNSLASIALSWWRLCQGCRQDGRCN